MAIHQDTFRNFKAQYEADNRKSEMQMEAFGKQFKLEVIEAFYARVCKRAEENMLKTGKLEGAHFAAMKTEIELLKQSTQE